MGNCRSKPAAASQTAPKTPDKAGNTNLRHWQNDAAHPPPNVDSDSSTTTEPVPSDSTVALIQALLPTAIPLVCQIVSQNLIADPATTLLQNEEPLTAEVYDEKNTPTEEQVLRDIQLKMSQINLVPASTMLQEMEQMPTFAWPERERVSELMNDHKMTVLDIVDFHVKVMLGKGIEFAVPVENPFGIPMTLEVGCGGNIIGDDAWFEITIPRLRIWIVQEDVLVVEDDEEKTKNTPTNNRKKKQVKAHIAFIGRPDLKPHLHINADRGKGDFFDMVLDEAGSLDDVVESLLMGFGPSEYYEMEEQQQDAKAAKKKEKHTQKQSWVGNALGKQLSRALGSFVGVGNNRPLEIDLSDAVTDAIDAAMGNAKPRPVEDVEAHIEQLHKELERSKQAEKEQKAAANANATKSSKKQSSSSAIAEEKKEESFEVVANTAPAEETLFNSHFEDTVLVPFTSACCGGHCQ